MKVTRPNENTKATEFENIESMLSYINATPITEPFKNCWSGPSSLRSGESWHGTKTFDDAVKLIKQGWSDKSKELEQKFEKVVRQQTTVTRQKSVYDVVGGNCSVARYLQGVPTNMIRQVRKPVKEKVKTVNYNIGFNCGTSAEQITQNAIDCLSYIKQLEDSGTRVNVNVVFAATKGSTRFGYGVCIKKSSERFSVAKMAFCLCHASMLRRIMFSLLERDTDVPAEYRDGYGIPVRDKATLGLIFSDAEFFN